MYDLDKKINRGGFRLQKLLEIMYNMTIYAKKKMHMKGERKMKKRLLALLLTAVMIVPSSITALAAEGTGTLENQVLNLAFEDNLNDTSGKGNDGEVNSGGTASYVEGVKGKALQFDDKKRRVLGEQGIRDCQGRGRRI